jgi:hypothetical protein
MTAPDSDEKGVSIVYTPDWRAVAAQLERAPDADIPEVLGALAAVQARLTRRMVESAARPPQLRLLTADEAAALGRMPRRRVYSLARHAPWAVRVGRRLLVDEAAFRRALTAQVRGRHERAPAATPARPKRLHVRVRVRQ